MLHSYSPPEWVIQPMKTKSEKRAKAKLKKLKLQARRIWILHDAPPEPEKIPKWEFELFKKIAMERSYEDTYWNRMVNVPHINNEWKETRKIIHIENLRPENFDHTITKWADNTLRLDPKNIEIVSKAWHFYKTNKQILKVDYPN